MGAMGGSIRLLADDLYCVNLFVAARYIIRERKFHSLNFVMLSDFRNKPRVRGPRCSYISDH